MKEQMLTSSRDSCMIDDEILARQPVDNRGARCSAQGACLS